MKRFCQGLVFVLLFILVPQSWARVNVVSLPGRDSVQLTIYNSVDLTLVKETRHLTFRKGLNKLEFSWANTLIDPTSVEFRALTKADQIEVLDVSFPPRVLNTLEWRINSESAGEVVVEIRYFTSGIRWSADYVVEAGRDEKTAALTGNVRVTNNSGEDYENAQVRLLVGVIKLVEEIAQLAQKFAADKSDAAGGRNRRLGGTELLREMEESKRKDLFFRFNTALAFDAAAIPERQEVTKESLSEYFLYTVGGRDTIANGWSKRLPSFHTEGVPIVSLYKFEPEQWGETVQRFYQFTNSVACKLGREPLPDGAVVALHQVTADGLNEFVGQTEVKYIPVDETVELPLGADAGVLVEPRLMDWQKLDLRFDREGNVAGWNVTENWTVRLQNTKAIAARIDFRRALPGDWTLKTSEVYEKMDANKVKFLFTLRPGESREFQFEVTTRNGINVTR